MTSVENSASEPGRPPLSQRITHYDKSQQFPERDGPKTFRGNQRRIAHYRLPLSESVVNTAYAGVAAQMLRLSDLRIVVEGKTLDRATIDYAGVTPGSPGLDQVNVRLPKQVTANPEIRLTIGDQSSPANMKLPLR